MQVSIPLSDYPAAGKLLLDYLAADSQVMKWFHFNASDSAAVSIRIGELEADPLASLRAMERGSYVAAVYTQQEQWGAGETALKAARLLGEPETFAVVTGQQAGLFGGPLYTVCKAIHAIKLARQLTAQHPGKRFVPMFWIASGDSDYDEIRSFSYLSQQGGLATISLPEEPVEDVGKQVVSRSVETEINSALTELETVLSSGAHRDETLTLLREAYADGNLVSGFARFMARLFQDTELLLIDPQDPVLMQAAKPLINKELTEGAVAASMLAERNSEVTAAGFELQVEQLPDDTPLFLIDESGRREKVVRDGEDFALRPSGRKVARGEMLARANVAPESFVLGVMLRPVYQNRLFPLAAWIGGGAEIAYRAQGSVYFDFHGEKLAPCFYRSTATLLSRRSFEQIEELRLELSDCYVVPQDLFSRAVGELKSTELDAAFDRYREALNSADVELKNLATELDPNLAQTFDTLRGNLERHVDKLEKKVTSTLKRQNEQLLKRAEQLHTLVYPQLVPQERVLGIAGFLPRYGLGLVNQLLDELTFPGEAHQVVVLE